MTFDAANREKAKQIVAKYPFARSAVLPLLHLAQEQDGWVSPDAINEVAGMVGIEPAQVLVSVFTNVSCLVNGGPELFEALSEQYDDATDVEVEEVECLAACDTAPVLQVNYEFHGNMAPEPAATIIDEYRSGTRVPRGVSGGKRA